MVASSPDTPSSDHEAALSAWSTLTELLARLSSAEDQGSFLERCLDDLLDVVGADRAIVLHQGKDGAVHPLCSRAKGRPLTPIECEEISRTVTRRALAARECVVVRPLDEMDATESMVTWGIGVAMAAPMRAVRWVKGASVDEPVGVLYVDFRDRNRRAGAYERALLQATAHVLGAALFSYQRLERAREDLRELASREIPADPSLDDLLRPESMAHVRREVLSCLQGDGPILIVGESGTGKTQLARAIARASGRTPIVRVVLGSSDDLNTITSELFGHEKGAFSGALNKRTGLVEFADGGTLIFDEILNLPPFAQQLLLDFTQFGAYRPLGHDRREPKQANVRIIAATNGDLAAAVAAGRFREDLYYRLAGAVLELPPMRARRQDIPELAESILRRFQPHRAFRLSPALRRWLVGADLAWPGNVRQLESAVRRAFERALADGPDNLTLEPEHFDTPVMGAPGARPRPPAAPPAARAPVSDAGSDVASRYRDLSDRRAELDAVERGLLKAALDAHDGVVANVARDLGVARTSLSSRLESLGVTRDARKKKGR